MCTVHKRTSCNLRSQPESKLYFQIITSMYLSSLFPVLVRVPGAVYLHPTCIPEIEPFICPHMFAHIPICPHVSSSVLARVSPAHWTLVPGWGSTLHVNHQPQHINMGSLKLQHPCPDQIDKNCSRVKGGCGRQVICLQSLAGACLTRAGP